VSTALTPSQVKGLRDAADRAVELGVPFNRMTTVHWGALGIDDADAVKATGRLIKLASDWCATKGVKMSWAWARENDEGDGSKGSHVHILLHCPADLPIGSMWRRWLRRLTNQKYRRGGIYSRGIGPTLDPYTRNPELYRENLIAAPAYMTKGAAPPVATEFGIPNSAPTGRVNGKRAAWSQTRGQSALSIPFG
jgi:hypothetical protein